MDPRGGLIASVRTAGNYRRYAVPPTGALTVGYARVSCHDQKEDLPRQIHRVRQHAGPDTVIVKDRRVQVSRGGLRRRCPHHHHCLLRQTLRRARPPPETSGDPS